MTCIYIVTSMYVVLLLERRGPLLKCLHIRITFDVSYSHAWYKSSRLLLYPFLFESLFEVSHAWRVLQVQSAEMQSACTETKHEKVLLLYDRTLSIMANFTRFRTRKHMIAARKPTVIPHSAFYDQCLKSCPQSLSHVYNNGVVYIPFHCTGVALLFWRALPAAFYSLHDFIPYSGNFRMSHLRLLSQIRAFDSTWQHCYLTLMLTLCNVSHSQIPHARIVVPLSSCLTTSRR